MFCFIKIQNTVPEWAIKTRRKSVYKVTLALKIQTALRHQKSKLNTEDEVNAAVNVHPGTQVSLSFPHIPSGWPREKLAHCTVSVLRSICPHSWVDILLFFCLDTLAKFILFSGIMGTTAFPSTAFLLSRRYHWCICLVSNIVILNDWFVELILYLEMHVCQKIRTLFVFIGLRVNTNWSAVWLLKRELTPKTNYESMNIL